LNLPLLDRLAPYCISNRRAEPVLSYCVALFAVAFQVSSLSCQGCVEVVSFIAAYCIYLNSFEHDLEYRGECFIKGEHESMIDR
jgi:hypothetical protein